MRNGVAYRRTRFLPTVVVLSALALFGRPAAADTERPHSAPPAALLSADFDRDGRQDSLVIDARNPSVLTVALSSGANATALVHSAPVVGSAVEDWDHDGDADIITLSANGRLMFWRNQGRGRFVPDALSSRRPRSNSSASLVTSAPALGDSLATANRFLEFVLAGRASIVPGLTASIAAGAPARFVFRSFSAAPDRPRPPPSLLS